jgi:hypothetical protein
MHKEGILTNGVLLIILSNEETHDATSFSEKNEALMLVVIEKDIEKFIKTHEQFTESIHIQVYQALTSRNYNPK